MSSLRIVHAISSDAFAGVERHVALLAAGQARAGHEVAVIGGEGQAMRSTLEPWGVIHRPGSTVMDVVRELDAFRRCDVVHAHMTAAEVAAISAPGVWSRPVVSTRHFARRRGASRAGHLVAPVIARRLAAQIAISSYVALAIDGASTVVHPGVAQVPVNPAVDRCRSVLVVQRLEHEKRTEDAIRMFASSGLAGQQWRLVIAGDGSERAALQALAGDLSVAAATEFLGYRRDVPELMRTAGLLLAPCDIEGLGMTVLEAMAGGLPVVACGAGGHLESVGTVSDGALYAPGDLADGALKLRELAGDESTRADYGSRLRTVQQTWFTVEAQVEATDAVYRRVLGRRRHAIR